jgi:hypothetical protein
MVIEMVFNKEIQKKIQKKLHLKKDFFGYIIEITLRFNFNLFIWTKS